MIDPKWLVLGVALVSLSMVFNYDMRLGLVGAALLAVLGAIHLWIAIRLAPARGEPASEREAMFRRFSALSRNRRSARAKELNGKGERDPR